MVEAAAEALAAEVAEAVEAAVDVVAEAAVGAEEERGSSSCSC
jgi:hypothetical protein